MRMERYKSSCMLRVNRQDVGPQRSSGESVQTSSEDILHHRLIMGLP